MRTLLVGKSGGIGKVIVQSYADAGYNVTFTFNENQSTAEEVAYAINTSD